MNYKKYLIVFFVFIAACKERHYNVLYSGFSLEELEPQSNKIAGLKVNAHYRDDRLDWLSYEKNNVEFRKDTVVYSKGIGYYLPFNTLNKKDNLSDELRVITSVNDTSRVFVFVRNGLKYQLVLIENNVNDSSITIQFVWKSNINPIGIKMETLDSLSNYKNYVMLFKESINLRYHYLRNTLYYKTIQDYGSWRAETEDYDSLNVNYGQIFFDLGLIEDNEGIMNEMKKLGW